MNEVQKLIQALKQYKLTETDIASKLRVSYHAVRSWVKGTRNPSYLVIEKLKQILKGHQTAFKRKE